MKLQDICLEMQMVQDSECLIEGTMKEKISHFMLRYELNLSHIQRLSDASEAVDL